MSGVATTHCDALATKLAQGLQAVFRHRYYVTHRALLQVTWSRCAQGIRFTFTVEFPSLRVVGTPGNVVCASIHILQAAEVELLARGTVTLDPGATIAVRDLVNNAVDHILQKLITRAFITPSTDGTTP